MKMQAFVIPAVLLTLGTQAHAQVMDACPNLEGVYQSTNQDGRTLILTITQSGINDQTQYQMVYEAQNESPETILFVTNGMPAPAANGQYLLTASCKDGSLEVLEDDQYDGNRRTDNRFRKTSTGDLVQDAVVATEGEYTKTEYTFWTKSQ